MRPCLFLDRDGVVIEDVGYPYKIEDLHVLDSFISTIRTLKKRGWWIVIVTNQSGLARGIFTDQEYSEFNRVFIREMEKKGAKPDLVLHCPHHVNGTHPLYGRECECRKPKPGLFREAAKIIPISIEQSLMIGDKLSDKIEGLPLRTFLLDSPYLEEGVGDSVEKICSEIMTISE